MDMIEIINLERDKNYPSFLYADINPESFLNATISDLKKWDCMRIGISNSNEDDDSYWYVFNRDGWYKRKPVKAPYYHHRRYINAGRKPYCPIHVDWDKVIKYMNSDIKELNEKAKKIGGKVVIVASKLETDYYDEATNLEGYSISAPQRKRAAPKKRTPAVKVNVRKMF